jgi:hypothetical protein
VKTWPENAEGHQTITSSQQPTSSPSHGGQAPLCSESDWYQKVSVCFLENTSSNATCQCVVAKLSPELRHALRIRNSSSSSSRDGAASLTLVLIAPHTFLHYENPRELREWRMYTGADVSHKSSPGGGLRLHDRYVSDFFTCCGPRGVWHSSSAHVGTYIEENSCPFQANFTVLVLKRELADQLREVLTIPSLPSLDEGSFSQALRCRNHYLSLIQREPSGVAETHKVLLKPPSSLAANDLTVEDSIAAYTETSHLQYTCGYSDSRSGAAVVYFDSYTPDNRLVLAAIHLYSRRDDEVFTHCGISLPAIFHAIAGSRVCGVIPCLSLLVGACNQCHWRPRFYQDLQHCLLPRNDPGMTI